MDYPLAKKLCTITVYAQKWGTTRDVIYAKLHRGEIMAYFIEGDKRTYLDLNEDPKLRTYSKDEEKGNP